MRTNTKATKNTTPPTPAAIMISRSVRDDSSSVEELPMPLLVPPVDPPRGALVGGAVCVGEPLEGSLLGNLVELLVGIPEGTLEGGPVTTGALEGASLGEADGNDVGAVVSKEATCRATILPPASP
jgi:hypothetical protein